MTLWRCLQSLLPVNLCQTTARSLPLVFLSHRFHTPSAQTSSEIPTTPRFVFRDVKLVRQEERGCCNHVLSAPGCLLSAVWENDVILVDSFCSFTHKKKTHNNIIGQYFHYVYFYILNKTFAKTLSNVN